MQDLNNIYVTCFYFVCTVFFTVGFGIRVRVCLSQFVSRIIHEVDCHIYYAPCVAYKNDNVPYMICITYHVVVALY